MRRVLVAGALAAILAAGCSGSDEGDSSDVAAPADVTDDATVTETETGDGSDDDTSDDAATGDDETASADPAGDDDAGGGDEREPTTSTTTSTTTIPAEPEPEDGVDIDRAVPADAEAESTGPIGTTETTIPTEEGEISIGGGDVPELGDDFPLPAGFEVQLTSEVEGEIGFSGRIDGDLAELTAFFEAALPEAGYEIVEQQEVPDVLTTMSIDGPLVGDVVISQEPGTDGGWTILVALAEPEA